jgi:N12 class adenine-specific DNA methylase
VQLLEVENRPAARDEQDILARWSSWGAIPQIFDEARIEWDDERTQLHGLLDEVSFTAARRTTLNAHYTDPGYVAEVWAGLERLGFTGGRVLEPGSGSGTFIGLAPAAAEMTGVELDPTSAAISRGLYPGATIRTESFAATRYPSGHFDAVVGNVPFADVRLHDPRHNPGEHSIHNHFIIKALALTRPGGMVAVLTSRYTLDGTNPAARREMNQLGDLVGAVRLPTGAHRRAAGTDVVTDLVILRRREPGATAVSTAWEKVTPRVVDGEVVRMNTYFDDHPDHILGDLAVGHGMYGENTLSVVAGDLGATRTRLRDALADITARAVADGHVFTARDLNAAAAARPRRVAEVGEGLWDGHLTAEHDGTFTVLDHGIHEPLVVPDSQGTELRALLGLRDRATGLLTVEAATLEDTADLDERREGLRVAYESYVARYGPINRFTLRSTGRTDPGTGEERLARVTPRVMVTLRRDPFGPLVTGLEVFDDAAQTAVPAALMRQRVVAPRHVLLGADTAEDALAVTLESHGHPDLTAIAGLLGVSEPEARDQLGAMVFDDPADRELVTRPDYLSGNVRDKLAAARAAAVDQPGFAVNVSALQDVLPTPLGIDDIEARLGAAWINAETHRVFLSEILGDSSVRVEHPGGAIWEVRGNTHSLAARSEWGTERMPAHQIVKSTLEQRPIQVTDDVGDGKRVLNPTETAAAQEKAGLIQDRFAEWVWEDPDRSERLVNEYNRRFNSLVLRDYSLEGDRLTLPGMALTFDPLPHQRAAAARMLSEPAVGLFHEVGAGKTAEMVIGTMELRRLGMVSKPAVVVPNHMLEQFSREWLQLYPQARVLAASSADLAGDKRRVFVARAAVNDWDAIIMTRSAFERIPVSKDTSTSYAASEIESMRRMLETAREGDGLTVKRVEKLVARAEEKLAKLLDGPEDAGLTFEETGIDYLVVDEMHAYKNLRTVSNIRDAEITGSGRASDLHMKVEYLRLHHGERVITAATATPIANSITEAHVMQRFLRPDLLEAAGVADFDVWAATFGQTVTEIEMAPQGGGSYRQATRFAKFQNVPEMLRMWHVFADVKTAEDLHLPTPDLSVGPDGVRGAHTVVIAPTEQVRAYVTRLGERAELVKGRGVDPHDDNMLKIVTDGRKAALDMRLVSDHATGEGNKLGVAATTIAGVYEKNRHRTYLDAATGEPSPVPGALQLVFCDLGTPSKSWNAYDELRDQLAVRGVPREAVQFIHSAKNDAEKGRLFAAARSGHVAVLIGSTEKMGVGVNVQDRAVALHHLDCPWRPADITQRDGRALRRGNQNSEISIYRYVVEGSFDAYSWQTVERKAKFITQIMRGRLDVREIDDVGDNALSFAEVKALASGDPLVLDKAHADNEVVRLDRLSRAYNRNQVMLGRTADAADQRVATGRADLPFIQGAVAQMRETRGEAFTMTRGGVRVTSRVDAAESIRTWAQENQTRIASHYDPSSARPLGALGALGGQTILAAVEPRRYGNDPAIVLTVQGVPRTELRLTLASVTADGVGTIRQIENHVAGLPQLAARVREQISVAEREAEQARIGLARPFKHSDALAAARENVADIGARMTAPTDEDDTALKRVTDRVRARTPEKPELTTQSIDDQTHRTQVTRRVPYRGGGASR